MTTSKQKYALSCRISSLATENHHKKPIKIHHRRVKIESKHLFSSGNPLDFHTIFPIETGESPIKHHAPTIIRLPTDTAFPKHSDTQRKNSLLAD